MPDKRQFTFISVLTLCLITAALLLVACSGREHTHIYEARETIAATCETEGETVQVCSECCKVSAEPTVIKPLGHLWSDGEINVDATCEEDGLMTYMCTRTGCGKDKTEKIKNLGHDWQEETVLEPATCEKAGRSSADCSRCDAKTDEHVIPALEHKWDGGRITTAPDCERQGEKLYTCTRENCTKTKTETLNMLGHSWGAWQTENAATCTEKGLEKRVCTRAACNEFQTRNTDALGHSWSLDYIIDKEPTYEQEGLKSKHCTNSGCSEKSDSQTISKLEVKYTVTVKDPCGDVYYGVATVTFEVDGKTVAQTAMPNSGTAEASLNSPVCKVKISELTAGYYVPQEEYELSADRPNLTVCLGATMLTGSSTGNYVVGSIIYDFSIDYYASADSEKQTILLSDILKVKKGILLNFYFKGCQPCVNEMPSLVSVAKTFDSDIQVLMVNEGIRNTSDDDVKFFQNAYAQDSPLWFLTIARSRWLYNYFGKLIGGFPTTILIDCNGQVVYAHTSTMNTTGFTSIINTYIINRYYKLHSAEKSMLEVNYYEAILPPKKFRLA